MKAVAIVVLMASAVLGGCSTQAKVDSEKQTAAIIKKSTNDQCVNNFSMVKKLNTNEFGVFRGQFDQINDMYAFLEQNRNILDNDPKQLISLELDSKLKMVCARVRNTAFNEVQNKVNYLSRI
ncbi:MULTISPECIES: hypothetical protein [Yersinia]|uniref:hypothetical protein n=1 Tax=Yersinia TaxID=629 RepID=UPI0005DAEBB3|nr:MULTISPECIES: hypothetical protein [Yersinia]OVZ95714.1 hypothetical protein CBW53_19190 [Yersinia frederiksenii]RXA95406.1 hypothetical protein EQP49_14210 [Yersinia sp. 2105 StPb PI]CNI82246.1 Uncharacterised protein [Yersinia frederiksenii]CNJ04161.1 Uncharacterised protein [Yersinia frederiksenii]CNK91910.1 Uncharacterised protein [Yersinia frederiksenii]